MDTTLGYINAQTPNFVIPANEQKALDIKIVASLLAKDLVETETINGVITGHVSSVDSPNTKYAFDIPITTKISVGEGVAEDNCLVIDGYKEWEAVIKGGGSGTIQFTIKTTVH